MEPDSPTREEILDQLEAWNFDAEYDFACNWESVLPKIAGWGARKNVKRKLDHLRRIEPILAPLLSDGEEVLDIAKGTQYSFWEYYFIGMWAFSINQTVFVLTNLRLIMIRTNGRGVPKKTYWMIFYSQIENLKATWNGMVQLRLRDGKKLSFSGFPKQDRKIMPRIFEETLDRFREHGFDPIVSQSMENLCSHCLNVVPVQQYECDRCGSTFWTPSAVMWRSLVFPSWGDLVMKHYLVGVMEFFGAFFAWLMFLFCVLAAIGGGGAGSVEVAMTLGISIAFMHIVDAVVTYYVSRKGLHLRKAPRKPFGNEERAYAAE